MPLPDAPSLPLRWPAVAAAGKTERPTPTAVQTASPDHPELPINLPKPDTAAVLWSFGLACALALLDKGAKPGQMLGRIILSTIAGTAFGSLSYRGLTSPASPWPLPANGWLALGLILVWATFGYRFFLGLEALAARFQAAPGRAIWCLWWMAAKVFRQVPEPPPWASFAALPSPPRPEVEDTAAGYTRLPRKERP